MQNITTITVDKNFDVGESNAIMIGEEVLEILPIDSKEGQLFQFVDKKKKKGALLRLRRHLTKRAPDAGAACDISNIIKAVTLSARTVSPSDPQRR